MSLEGLPTTPPHARPSPGNTPPSPKTLAFLHSCKGKRAIRILGWLCSLKSVQAKKSCLYLHTHTQTHTYLGLCSGLRRGWGGNAKFCRSPSSWVKRPLCLVFKGIRGSRAANGCEDKEEGPLCPGAQALPPFSECHWVFERERGHATPPRLLGGGIEHGCPHQCGAEATITPVPPRVRPCRSGTQRCVLAPQVLLGCPQNPSLTSAGWKARRSSDGTPRKAGGGLRRGAGTGNAESRGGGGGDAGKRRKCGGCARRWRSELRSARAPGSAFNRDRAGRGGGEGRGRPLPRGLEREGLPHGALLGSARQPHPPPRVGTHMMGGAGAGTHRPRLRGTRVLSHEDLLRGRVPGRG